MPELPEVETTIRGLKNNRAHNILGARFLDVWTDFEKMIKRPKDFSRFKKDIKSRRIENIRRRAKNILFNLSGKKVLLIHQKMTGHLLLGKWKRKNGQWISLLKGPLLDDPMNRFLHLVFWLDSGTMLALSDLRKFAKVELWEGKELERAEGLKALGPEPLDRSFTLGKFKEIAKRKRGKTKQVLMDQKVISGIGNIYSDEILFEAKIHPQKDISKLSEEELKTVFLAIKKILRLAVKLQGESFSDYRKPSGEKGGYDKSRMVYRRKGEKCPRCGNTIKRIKMGGRSAHFCPNCQKL